MPTTAPSSARPLVLLPGMLCDARLWEPAARALTSRRQVLHRPLAGSSVDAAVQDVLRLPFPRFDLAGLSLGGIVAMHLVLQAPERVGRLVLLSTNARSPRPDQLTGWDALQRRAAAGDLEGLAEDLLPSLLRPAALRDPELRRTTLAMAQATGAERLLEQLDLQRSRTDLRPLLSAVRVPTLVVSAQDDALCPPHLHQEIADALPVSQLVTVPDCGHLSTLERPDEVAALLLDWLATADDLEPSLAGGAR